MTVVGTALHHHKMRRDSQASAVGLKAADSAGTRKYRNLLTLVYSL